MKHTIAELIAILAMDTTKFKQGIKGAETSMSKMAKNLQKLGKQGMKYVTLPLVAAGTASVKMAMDFETSITALYTIMDEATYKSRDWGQEVIDLSKKMGESTDTLADGLYFLVGSGIDAADAMGVLEIAAKSAKAGFTDTATAVKALASILNSYQLGAEDAEKVSDILFATVNFGVITYEELAHGIGKVLPVAAAANVSLEELGAALTVMTLGGLRADEAMVALRATILTLLDPTPQAVEIAEELGFTLSATALASDGLYGTLKKMIDALGLTGEAMEELNDPTLTEAQLQKLLAERAGTTTEKIAKMFTNVRALVGVLSLVKGEGKEFTKQMENMGATAGTLETAFSKVAETTKFQFDLAMSSLKATSIEIGTKLLPMVTKLFKGVGNLAGKFGDLSDAGQTAVIAIGGIAATIPVLLYVTGSVLGLIIKFKTLGIVITAAKVAAVGMYSVIGTAAVGAGLYMKWSYEKAIEMNEKYESIQRGTQQGIHEIGETVKRSQYEVAKATEESTRTIEENIETIMEWCYFSPQYLKILDELNKKWKAGDITLKELEDSLQFLINTQGMYEGSAERVIKNVDKSVWSLNEQIRATRELKDTTKDAIPALEDGAEAIKEIGDEADEAGKSIDELIGIMFRLYNLSQATTTAEWRYLEAIKEQEETLKVHTKTVGGGVEAKLANINAQENLTKATEKYNKVTSDGKSTEKEVLEVTIALTNAKKGADEATNNLTVSTKTYTASEKEKQEALFAVQDAREGLLSSIVEELKGQDLSSAKITELIGKYYEYSIAGVKAGETTVSEWWNTTREMGVVSEEIGQYLIDMGIEAVKSGVITREQFNTMLAEFNILGEGIGKEIMTKIIPSYDKMERRGGELGDQVIEPEIYIRDKPALSAIEDVGNKLEILDGKSATVFIDIKETRTVREKLEKFMGKEGALFSGQAGKYFQTGKEVPVIVHPPEVLLNPKQALNLVWNLANLPASPADRSQSPIQNNYTMGDFNISQLLRDDEFIKKLAREIGLYQGKEVVM